MSRFRQLLACALTFALIAIASTASAEPVVYRITQWLQPTTLGVVLPATVHPPVEMTRPGVATVTKPGTAPATVMFPAGDLQYSNQVLLPTPPTAFGVFYSKQGWKFDNVAGTLAPNPAAATYTFTVDGFPAAPPQFPSPGPQATPGTITVTPAPGSAKFGGSWDLGVVFDTLNVFADGAGGFNAGRLRIPAGQHAPFNSTAVLPFHPTGNPLITPPVFSTTACPTTPASCPWAGSTIPLQVENDGARWTTGMVTNVGQNPPIVPTVTATLSTTGADNRSGPMSSMGSLQMVSANMSTLRGVLNLPPGYSNTLLNIEFLPEPGATTLLAVGIGGLVLLLRAGRSKN